ncbi:MAG: type II toxin-antitoxin system HicA family toxin [Scytonema sp. CRU_2_7]|nr:type II toxin-antitoxin system HicA family toxin [Scytonema sp. CRU_2_7]
MLNSKQQKTLEEIFETPTRSNILWTDVESLFLSLGATVQQGKGSRVRVALNGVKAVFHEPHPQKKCLNVRLKTLKNS